MSLICQIVPNFSKIMFKRIYVFPHHDVDTSCSKNVNLSNKRASKAADF